MESQYLEELIDMFRKIKKEGWHPSTRRHNTGIGKTFEDLLDKEEDNAPSPDFGDIEIKTQRSHSNSYVTLFTKAPDYPRRANTYLRNEFGVPYEEYPELNKLHTSIFGDKFNSYNNRYGFKAKVRYREKKVYILIKDLETGSIVSDQIYYSFSTLEDKLFTKLKKVAYVTGDSRSTPAGEEFKFNSIEFLYEPKIDKFIEMINEGDIMIDIRIGSYKNPNSRSYGKTHDHGTGFRIKQRDFDKLFEIYNI